MYTFWSVPSHFPIDRVYFGQLCLLHFFVEDRISMSEEIDVPGIEEFFEELLPAAIARQPQNFNAVEATISINVHRVGAWSIYFGDHLDPDAVEEGLDLEADLIVTFTEEGFEEVLAGDFPEDPNEPLLLGDPTLLERFGRLLLPPVKGGLF